MSKTFLYIILMLIFSCKKTENSSSVSTNSKDSTYKEIKKSPIKSVGLAEESKEIEDEECIFDQSTQTDEFLKDIEELENYIWSKENRTATIKLSDTEVLKIYRGGCMDFSLSATFIFETILDLEKDEKSIFDRVVWITLLLKEFDGEEIKKVIEDGKIVITKEDEFDYYVNFMDEKLYEFYYFNFNNKDRTTFEIGYYLN